MIHPVYCSLTIRATELEKQIIEILEKIEIPSEFHKWAIKCLKEEQGKETNDNAEKFFSFAETAKERFENSNLIVKREILACLGSNLSLMDRKLNIQLQPPLPIFFKYAPRLKIHSSRLEPVC